MEQPWLFPPTETERWLMEMRDEDNRRRRLYYARKNKGGKNESKIKNVTR